MFSWCFLLGQFGLSFVKGIMDTPDPVGGVNLGRGGGNGP
jgi:hypothetical protein